MRNILFSAALVMSLLYPALSSSEDYRELAFASGLSAEVEVVQERTKMDTTGRVVTGSVLGAAVGAALCFLADRVRVGRGSRTYLDEAGNPRKSVDKEGAFTGGYDTKSVFGLHIDEEYWNPSSYGFCSAFGGALGLSLVLR